MHLGQVGHHPPVGQVRKTRNRNGPRRTAPQNGPRRTAPQNGLGSTRNRWNLHKTPIPWRRILGFALIAARIHLRKHDPASHHQHANQQNAGQQVEKSRNPSRELQLPYLHDGRFKPNSKIRSTQKNTKITDTPTHMRRGFGTRPVTPHLDRHTPAP